MKEKLDQSILTITSAIIENGGRPLVVGGWVRDQLLGIDSKDVDIEVYNMPLDTLQEVLSAFGEVDVVGRAFGVLKVHGLDVDFSLPRRDSKVGEGHKGFEIIVDPDMTPEEAARRRDLTINSMSLDIISDEIVDPFNGQRDLEKKILRATDRQTFKEDPLRALRVCQFGARFPGFKLDVSLGALCTELGEVLHELPGERIMVELEKLFLKGKDVGKGLRWLEMFCFVSRSFKTKEELENPSPGIFPELQALMGCPQDKIWHPEGDVWTHTIMVVEEAAKLRTGDREHDLVLMFAALCHDLGKPATTTFEVGGKECSRDHYEQWLYYWELAGLGDGEYEEVGEDKERPKIRSKAHEPAGEEPTRSFLGRLAASNDLIDAVCALVVDHLAPHTFKKNRARASAFRRLARRLGKAGTNLEMLHKVATADHYGRSTPDAIAREYPAGDWFIEKASDLEIKEEGPQDIVMGRHLIAMGWQPGPEFGIFLDKCREVQYETSWTDPQQIIQHILEEEREEAINDTPHVD